MMRTVLKISGLLFVMLLLALPDTSLAQNVVPASEDRKSPLAQVRKKYDDGTYVKIVYGSPRKRGRQVFGGLEAYGKVWRLGANEATELTTTDDISIGGKRLPAGTYSLYAIPQQDKWTIIVNKDLGAWGAYSYNQANDVLRFDVPVRKTSETVEAFTINFDKEGNNLTMAWDDTQVTVPIKPM